MIWGFLSKVWRQAGNLCTFLSITYALVSIWRPAPHRDWNGRWFELPQITVASNASGRFTGRRLPRRRFSLLSCLSSLLSYYGTSSATMEYFKLFPRPVGPKRGGFTACLQLLNCTPDCLQKDPLSCTREFFGGGGEWVGGGKGSLKRNREVVRSWGTGVKCASILHNLFLPHNPKILMNLQVF